MESLATALGAHVLARDAIAIVDAPRVPLAGASSRRSIDAALRRIVADRGIKLSMFPTPKREEFEAFAADPRCKPHLVAIARRIFGKTRRMPTVDTLPRGRLFTRFMLAGFATHLALDAIGTRTYEGYPYLAFSLWKPPHLALPPKSDRTALAVRIAILRDLARTLDIRLDAPASLDEADAASLAITNALCARSRGTAFAISDPDEGQFLLAMPLARGA